MNIEGIDWNKSMNKFEILFSNDDAEKVAVVYLSKMETLSLKESLDTALKGFDGYKKPDLDNLAKAVKFVCRNRTK